MAPRMMSQAEALARAGSPERLLRKCHEHLIAVRFKFVRYVHVEGQPFRPDSFVPWSWWAMRDIHFGPGYIDSAAGGKRFVSMMSNSRLP
jgi:hypothetical protein